MLCHKGVTEGGRELAMLMGRIVGLSEASEGPPPHSGISIVGPFNRTKIILMLVPFVSPILARTKSLPN